MALLTVATVHKSVLDGFRALRIATCGRFSSLADDLPDLREAPSEMFNVDKKHGPLHRLEASKLVEVWSQAKARTETQHKVESAAQAYCKDNTPQDRFRSVKLFKEFAYRSEIE